MSAASFFPGTAAIFVISCARCILSPIDAPVLPASARYTSVGERLAMVFLSLHVLMAVIRD